MSEASTSALPIVLGPTLDGRAGGRSRQTLVSVKYNFKPPSIAGSSAGLLHCPKKNQADWLLEYAGSQGEGAGAQGFTGTQSAAKDVDCVLVWDEKEQAYILDRLASNFSLKFERKHTKLSKAAQELLPESTDTSQTGLKSSALGLNIPDHELETRSMVEKEDEDDDVQMAHDDEQQWDGEGGSDDFARQLQQDLEAIGEDSTADGHSRDKPEHEAEDSSPKRSRTGLGLVGANGLQDEVITPRGSPYIDRPTKALGAAAATSQVTAPNSVQMRSTPGMSPASVANSPRPTGLESSLSATWRPPAQRSNVALAYDEDEEEDDDDDEESEEDEEEEEEEEEEDTTAAQQAAGDDDDLDAFARQLEGSLMEPPTPVDEKPSSSVRTRRASTRSKR